MASDFGFIGMQMACNKLEQYVWSILELWRSKINFAWTWSEIENSRIFRRKLLKRDGGREEKREREREGKREMEGEQRFKKI